MALPVISFRTGEIPEMVIHMENGYIAEKLDVDDLAKGIELVYKDRDLLNKFTKNSLETAKKRFTREIYLKNNLNIYAKII